MNVYSIKFRTSIAIDEEGRVLGEEEVADESLRKPLEESFELGAESLGEAFIEATEFLEAQLDEGDYDIVSVTLLDINILNWPGDGEPCPCVWCRTERSAEEDKVSFVHSCGGEIKVVSDGWDSMLCPRCGEVILRDRLVGSGRVLTFLDIDK